jgi:hypothetical protein
LDVRRFWSNYAGYVALDIGHIEDICFYSVEFVLSLEEDCIKKIRYVHMHRNNGWRGGLTDHWALSHDCRELRALKKLIKIKADVSAILEINETEMIEESLKLLRALRVELNA